MINSEKSEIEYLGYAVKLVSETDENSYFMQNFKFKFNSKNRDATQFAYSRLKTPTTKTNKDSYIHDFETAEIIIKVMKLYDLNGKIFKVMQNEKLIIEEI